MWGSLNKIYYYTSSFLYDIDYNQKLSPRKVENYELIDNNNAYLNYALNASHTLFSVVKGLYSKTFSPFVNTVLYTARTNTDLLKSDNIYSQCAIDIAIGAISQLVIFNPYGATSTAALTAIKCVVPTSLTPAISVLQDVNDLINSPSLIIKIAEGTKIYYTLHDNIKLKIYEFSGSWDDSKKASAFYVLKDLLEAHMYNPHNNILNKILDTTNVYGDNLITEILFSDPEADWSEIIKTVKMFTKDEKLLFITKQGQNGVAIANRINPKLVLELMIDFDHSDIEKVICTEADSGHSILDFPEGDLINNLLNPEI